MVQKIPLSKDFQITPNVVSPAGTALESNGLVLSDSPLIPVGDVLEVYSAKQIGDLLGTDSKEYIAATTYFNGYRDSFVKPAKLLFSNIATQETSAFLLSGSMRGTKPTDFSQLAGALSVVIDGKVVTGNELLLANVTSYSDIATAIADSFINPVREVTFTPSEAEIPLGSNSVEILYSVQPTDTTTDLFFEIPEANKDQVKIDTKAEKITIIRGTTAEYQILAKSDLTGDIVGTLNVSVAQPTLVTKVSFDPENIDVANDKDTGSSVFTITPEGATEKLTFSVPEANKNDIKVDYQTNTVTVTRNAEALNYTVTVKGETSGDTVGTLQVTFNTASNAETIRSPKKQKYVDIATIPAEIKTNTNVIQVHVAQQIERPLLCEWLVTSQCFLITIPSAGDNSTISFFSSDDSDISANTLKLTAATGAQKSNGSAVKTGEQVMNMLTDGNQNFILFTTLAELSDEQKESYCRFASNSNSRFGYVYTDNSQAALIPNNPECFHQKVVIANNYDSIFPMFGDLQYAMLPLAYAASLNFNATNGRVSFKFRRFTSMVANVNRLADAMALDSNGYNYLGAYGLNATLADYASQGKITGQYIWLDSFIDQVWLNANLVTSFLALFLANQSYPFNVRGYATVETAVGNVASRGLTYGAVQTGITLDPEQLAIVTGETGLDLESVLFNQGWYFYIPPQRGETRLERVLSGTIFYWVDGQLIQSIKMSSTTIL